MSKIFIIENCTKCPNFIPCTDPRDFRVSCTKLGCLGSPLIFIGGGFPIECPLNDYAEPKTGHWENYCYQNNRCSVCGYIIADSDTDEYKYCPNCGAIMIKQQESEAKHDKRRSDKCGKDGT